MMNNPVWNIGDLRGSQDTREEAKEMNIRETDLEEMTIREKVLEEAKQAVCQDRNDQYGAPENNFEVIARLWSEYLTQILPLGVYLDSLNVANMMILLKVARIISVPASRKPSFDNFVDIAGYAACAAECVFGNEADRDV